MFAKVRKGILQNTTVYAPITFEEIVIVMINPEINIIFVEEIYHLTVAVVEFSSVSTYENHE